MRVILCYGSIQWTRWRASSDEGLNRFRVIDLYSRKGVFDFQIHAHVEGNHLYSVRSTCMSVSYSRTDRVSHATNFFIAYGQSHVGMRKRARGDSFDRLFRYDYPFTIYARRTWYRNIRSLHCRYCAVRPTEEAYVILLTRPSLTYLSFSTRVVYCLMTHEYTYQHYLQKRLDLSSKNPSLRAFNEHFLSIPSILIPYAVWCFFVMKSSLGNTCETCVKTSRAHSLQYIKNCTTISFTT